MVAVRRDGLSAARPGCEECGVRPLAICGALSADELPRIEALATDRRLEAGQVLFHEGDPAREVFNVTSGMIKLYKLLSDGRRQITGFLMAGDFLGLAFTDSHGYTAEAVEPTTVCRFGRAQFLRLLEELPAMEKRLLSRASDELESAQEQMLLLGRKTARERVASFLAAMSRRQERAGLRALSLPMSRADMADYLGLTLETVSRTLSRLRDEGIIVMPATHEAVVANWRSLQRAAGA
jgi:CRP/FNR family transcriptional regulator